ncbi:MAG: hypothetical protein AAF267_12750 [Deinococcota bacterium]
MPLVHKVALPLGDAIITLDRQGLALEARGGFEARWMTEADEADTASTETLESYRAIVKTHMQEVYVAMRQREPSTISLNLASHQLIDDVIGWSKLNIGSRP